MSLIIANTIFAFSIFVLTCITGLAPLKLLHTESRLSTISDAFASGVFLGTALLHMLPDAVLKFKEVYTSDYPIAYLICLATCISLLLIERGLFIYSNAHPGKNKFLLPISLVSLLTMHSLIEGAAIGINNNILEAMAIFIAVFAHKGSESFALAVNLRRFALTKNTIKKTILIFSLMTPLGIFIASYVLNVSISNSGGLLIAIFNSIAAGTFLYLSTEHLIEGKKSFENLYEVIALITGASIMAVVALCV